MSVGMVSLSWSQVNTWRLSEHYLLKRADRRNLLEVVTGIGGVHAQLMSAAGLALWARVNGLTPADVADALWRGRSLIKTWAMRGTLHLLTARDFPLYVAAREALTIRRPPSYYTYHGVTLAELDAIMTGIPNTLSANPLTREQLAAALAQGAGSPNLRQVLLSGWGSLLKPSAFRGDLCFGPNQGQNVTFVRPSEWLGDLPTVEPQHGLREMARRYLTTYGPATAADFARWWGMAATPAKKLFQSLNDELAAVDVEGWPAWALASTLEPLLAIKAIPSVRLLPQFDAYVVGLARDCGAILPPEFKSRVYRPQGWISAVVLVDGRIAGTWTYDRQRRTVVKVNMFTPPSDRIKDGIETEAICLGNFLDSDIEVVYE